MVHEQNNQQNAKIKDLTPWLNKKIVDNGYVERLPDNYNQELLLEPEILLTFVKDIQPEEWENSLILCSRNSKIH